MGIRMEVKEAVHTAYKYISELFADEGIEYIGLEEVTFDDTACAWNVTIGFFRRWDRQKGLSTIMGEVVGGEPRNWKKRSFKVVQIDDNTGRVVAMTHRTVPAAN